ncbi:hypothetical protein D3C83_207800 [compost metagenome]
MVVPRFPAPVRNVLLFPEPAEIDAVGIPELTLRTANEAELVDWPPIAKSTVELRG